MKKETNKSKKKKIEFSKILAASAIIICTLIAIWSIIEYYALAKLAIECCSSVLPDVTLPVTCISVILGAILSYCIYQFGLKNSRNKYGIDCDGQPFKSKTEYEDDDEDNN